MLGCWPTVSLPYPNPGHRRMLDLTARVNRNPDYRGVQTCLFRPRPRPHRKPWLPRRCKPANLQTCLFSRVRQQNLLVSLSGAPAEGLMIYIFRGVLNFFSIFKWVYSQIWWKSIKNWLFVCFFFIFLFCYIIIVFFSWKHITKEEKNNCRRAQNKKDRKRQYILKINTTQNTIVIRSYHGGNTGSHSNSEVKHHWACLVLRWGTTREPYVVNDNCFFFFLFFFSNLLFFCYNRQVVLLVFSYFCLLLFVSFIDILYNILTVWPSGLRR